MTIAITSRKTAIRAAATLGLGMLAPFAQAQQAGPEWDFYGQLNLGVVSVDDGVNRETSLTDNDNSNSRIGLTMTRELQDGASFRFNVETALGFTGSASLNGADDGFDASYRRTELRKLEISYSTPAIGKFSFGQGSMSADGAAEADLSGTGVAAYVGINDLAGSQVLRFGNGTLSNVALADTSATFNGTRRFRVRYDTPAFNGFSGSVSAGKEILTRGNDTEYYDLGATYDREYGDYTVDARFAYSFRSANDDLVVGSMAVLHGPTGLNAAFATGKRIGSDSSYGYVKAGLTRDFVNYGATSFSVDYFDGSDFIATGTNTSSVGVAVAQQLDAYNTELYATHRSYTFESAPAAFQDLDVTLVGARWQF